jgi:hypothetical protein
MDTSDINNIVVHFVPSTFLQVIPFTLLKFDFGLLGTCECTNIKLVLNINALYKL